MPPLVLLVQSQTKELLLRMVICSPFGSLSFKPNRVIRRQELAVFLLYLPRGCPDKARNSDEWHKNTEHRILKGVTELMVEKVLSFVANYDGCAEGDAAPFARNQKVVR